MIKHRTIAGDETLTEKDQASLGWERENARLAATDNPSIADDAQQPDDANAAGPDPSPSMDLVEDPADAGQAQDKIADPDPGESTGESPAAEANPAADEQDKPGSQHVSQPDPAIDTTIPAVTVDQTVDLAVLADAALPIYPHEGLELHGESELFLPHDLIAFGPLSFGRPSHAGGGSKKGGGRGNNDDPEVLSSYTSGEAANSSYNITIKFKGGEWTADLQKAFIDASDWISGVIEADVIDAYFRGKVIDDLHIDATVQAIDGTGGVLGQAGPTAIRQAQYDYLPAKAAMTFDVADAQDLLSGSLAGYWGAVVLHEMLHSVGVGTIWDLQGLIGGFETAAPTFTGENAVLAYQDLFSGTGEVPLEYGFGPGTDYSHWDEDTFDNELMTGFIDTNADTATGLDANYISGMTVASLVDIGYAADPLSYSDQIVHVV
jgi:hypothetical protein